MLSSIANKKIAQTLEKESGHSMIVGKYKDQYNVGYVSIHGDCTISGMFRVPSMTVYQAIEFNAVVDKFVKDQKL